MEIKWYLDEVFFPEKIELNKDEVNFPEKIELNKDEVNFPEEISPLSDDLYKEFEESYGSVRELNNNRNSEFDIYCSESLDEDFYNVGQLVRDIFYVSSLKTLDYKFGEDKSKYVKRLNKLDSLSERFMEWGKYMVSGLERGYISIPKGEDPDFEEAASSYFDEIYFQMHSKKFNRENLNYFRRNMLERRDLNLDAYVSKIENSLEQFCEGKMNSKSSVYKQVRDLLKYFGSPYKERYFLYYQMSECRKYINKRVHRLSDLVLRTNVFDAYYNHTVNMFAGDIARCQSEMLKLENVIQDTSYMDIMNSVITLDMEKNNKKFFDRYKPKKCKGGCIGISTIYFNSGNKSEYIFFSGMYDTNDSGMNEIFNYLKVDKNKRYTLNGNKSKAEQIHKSIDTFVAALNRSPGYHINHIRSNPDIEYCHSKIGRIVSLEEVLVNTDLANVNNKINLHTGYKRMFSCCEKVFFSKLKHENKKDFKKYVMYIKMNPCEICEPLINYYAAQGYDKYKIHYGFHSNPSIKQIGYYDKLALDVMKNISSVNKIDIDPIK